jgi:hypothetical protein
MTDIGDERKHKPSAKHTLEEVRKSLEDLVRNEFVGAGPAATQDHKTSDQVDGPVPFASAPLQRSRQRLQTLQKRSLDTGQVLKSLNELIGNDLSETDRHDDDGIQPTTEVDADTGIDTPTTEPGAAELADQDMSAHTESLESLAAALAEADEVKAGTSDVADAIELMDENATAEEIPWTTSSDVSTDDDYPIVDEDADDLDAAIGPTADMQLGDAGADEATLEAAPADASPVEAPTDEALSPTPTPKDRGREVPETEAIELSLDETEVTADESLGVDFTDAVTPTSSESLPSPELSLADDGPEPGLTEDAAIPADRPPPTAGQTPHSRQADRSQESVEHHAHEAGPFVSEAQRRFDFGALGPAASASADAQAAAESALIDEIEPKELHKTAEIADETPRQAENSELRLEDTTSALVEPADAMVPLAPEEEMSVELGAELEAITEASSSADDAGVKDDAPASSPIDALEIPGKQAMSEEVTEEDKAVMQNSSHKRSTTISRKASDATTVLLTPNEAQSADQEFADEPAVELDHGEPVSEISESAIPAPAEVSPENKPSETKQASTPVVTLPSDKQESVTSKAPATSPKNKIFTVASPDKAKELKMPGIDFDLGTGGDKGTQDVGTEPDRSGAAGDSSPDDSEYIDLAEPTAAKDAVPAVKSSKDGYKRASWPTPSALFRKNSAAKPKQTSGMPWGGKGVATRAKGSPGTIEPPSSASKFDVLAKTLEPTQPTPKAKLEQHTENIPVLNKVVDRPAESKKPKKKPVPLAAPKVTSAGASRKKQSKHKILEPSSATAKTEARNVAVNVIAKLNMELRKCGERTLSPVTIDRLQFLLREALEQHARDVETSHKRR